MKFRENLSKKKVMDILHKQRAELDAEYEQVLKPVEKPRRKSTAKKVKPKQPQIMSQSPFDGICDGDLIDIK